MEKKFALIQAHIVNGVPASKQTATWFESGADAFAAMAKAVRRTIKTYHVPYYLKTSASNPLMWSAAFRFSNVPSELIRFYLQFPEGAEMSFDKPSHTEPEKVPPVGSDDWKDWQARQKQIDAILNKRKYKSRGKKYQPYGEASKASLINV